MAEPTKTPGTLPTKKSRVFIVDDHTMFREGLRKLLHREPGLTVCGDAADADEAMRGIRQTKPDIVLVDISLKIGRAHV